jgi:hydroxymethylpyrimidine pyrophosphatase-like HAD family hydrolase
MTQKPSKKKRIVSFDLDMTLLDHKTWKIPDSAMKALELLRKDSVIAIGSGRNMDHDMSVVYRDMIMPDAVIHMNGTRVVAEGNVLFEHLMDKERLRALLEYGDAHGISLGVSQEGKDYYIHPEGVVRMDRLRWGVSERNFMDGIAGYAGEDIGLHRRSGRRQGAGSPFS